MAKIQTITAKDTNNNSAVFDLDNRYIELTGTSGTLTTDQLALLQASNQNYIIYSGGGKLTKINEDNTYLYYARQTTASSTKYYIIITKSSRAFTYGTYSWTDTKNTAGSTNDADKLFLVGAKSQAANPQTYSNANVYTQDGVLYSEGKAVANILTKEVSNNPSASSFDITVSDAEQAPILSTTLKGKTAVLNQLIDNGDFAIAPSKYNCSVSVANNELSATVTAAGGYWGKTGIELVSGHTYLWKIDLTEKGSSSNIRVALYNNGALVDSGWNYLGVTGEKTKIFTSSINATNAQFFFYGGVNKTDKYKAFMLIDLTLCGFTSDETASVDALKTAWLSKYGYPLPQYIPYNAGSIVSNNATYQLTGKNLLDASTLALRDVTGGGVMRYAFAPILLPAGTYILSKAAGTNQCYLTNITTGYTTTSIASWPFSFTLTEPNTVMVRTALESGSEGQYNLSNVQLEEGTTATTYEPFHDGGSIVADSLNGIGTVADEQDASGAIIRRFASVDLGDLSWTLSGSIFVGAGISPKIPTMAHELANIACAKYIPIDSNHIANGNVAISSGGKIWIMDSAYTDAATFTTAMSGVYLVYELATETTDATTPASLTTQKGYNLLRTVSGDIQSAEISIRYVTDEGIADLVDTFKEYVDYRIIGAINAEH